MTAALTGSIFETDNSFEKFYVYSCKHGFINYTKSNPGSDWNLKEIDGKFFIPMPQWIPNPLGLKTTIRPNQSFVLAHDGETQYIMSQMTPETNLAYLDCSSHETPQVGTSAESTEFKTNSVYQSVEK